MYKKKLDGYIHKGSVEVYLENYKSEKYNMIYGDKMEIRLVSIFVWPLYIGLSFIHPNLKSICDK